MKVNCPDCKTVVTIDETPFHSGETAQAFCPRCGATVTAVVAHGGQDLPVKQNAAAPQRNEMAVHEVEVMEARPVSPTNDDIELRKAELALKAKELELKQRELEHSINSSQSQQSPQPTHVVEHVHHYVQEQYVPVAGKSKNTAGILGILLGGIGAHHFYLGNTGRGFIYLIFCWTYIPAFIGLIEGISYLVKSDADFAAKYPKR